MEKRKDQDRRKIKSYKRVNDGLMDQDEEDRETEVIVCKEVLHLRVPKKRPKQGKDKDRTMKKTKTHKNTHTRHLDATAVSQDMVKSSRVDSVATATQGSDQSPLPNYVQARQDREYAQVEHSRHIVSPESKPQKHQPGSPSSMHRIRKRSQRETVPAYSDAATYSSDQPDLAPSTTKKDHRPSSTKRTIRTVSDEVREATVESPLDIDLANQVLAVSFQQPQINTPQWRNLVFGAQMEQPVPGEYHADLQVEFQAGTRNLEEMEEDLRRADG